MFSAEIISKRLGEKIARELHLDENNREVIAYGIFAIIQMIYNLILVLIVGLLFNVAIEALIVSIIIGVLRKYSGGIHASKASTCAIIGTIISVGIGAFAKWRFIEYIIIIEIITFLWAYLIIIKLAPVDSKAKPIKTDKKKQRLKRKSIIIITLYLIIVSINTGLYYYFKIDRLYIYSICIIGGVIWQVFTLTKTGHSIVTIIDGFIEKIISFILEVKNNEKN